MLSIASWINGGQLAGYAASKSAAWSLTNALRHELAAQKTQVLALHMAFVDTDLVRALDGPKTSPEEIVRRALDGLEAGLDEVLADELTQQVKQGLSAPPPSYLPQRRLTRVRSPPHRSQPMTIASATAPPPRPSLPLPTASPWPVFWVASVASFLVSLDATMLYAAFGALRARLSRARARPTCRGCSTPTRWSTRRC